MSGRERHRQSACGMTVRRTMTLCGLQTPALGDRTQSVDSAVCRERANLPRRRAEVGDWRAVEASGASHVRVQASHLFLMARSIELEVTSSHSGVYKTRQANDQHDRGSGATDQTLRGP